MPFIQHISGPRLQRSNSGASVEYVYRSWDYPTPGDAANAIAAALPANVIDDNKVLVLSAHDTDPIDGSDDAYEHVVTYVERKAKESEDQPDTGQSEFSFSIQGQATRINAGFEHHSYSGGNGTKDDADIVNRYGGAINVDRDGKPQGVDIVVPMASYQETHYVASITQSWFRGVGGIVGRTNKDKFRAWNPREMLLTSVSGSQRGSEDWALTFEWSVDEHETGLEIAQIQNVEKEAHDYLWVDYRIQPVNGKSALTARAVFVHRVYKPKSYGPLGIGS